VRPPTVTGLERFDVPPSPSCPLALAPQQRTLPSARRPHVWACPAASATTPSSPVMRVGTFFGVLLPSPSWPMLLSPQHATVLSARTAHVWSAPTAISRAVTLPAIPDTARGVLLSSVVPSPSWPKLLLPQQRAVPSARIAQVWSNPVRSLTVPVSIATALSRPLTATGVRRSVVVPSPSSPWPFEPQQRALPSERTAHV